MRVENEIETKLLSLQPDDMFIEEIAMTIKNTIMEVANNEVGVVGSRKKEVWMTDEILELMYERSRYKNKGNRKYKDIHRSIRVLIRKAKEEFHKKECKYVTEKDETLRMWKNYIQTIFASNRSSVTPDQRDELGPHITLDEVQKPIDDAKIGKTVGSDQIPTELVKLFIDNGIRNLTRFFNNIYNTGQIPNHWLQSTFIMIPKKTIP
ncbi:uncharacterized protein LOC119675303 [Teleopsis dalmanni]|uniref:uncharacterized protein LOC119675303 n=1 Tax=Teleopsis dalmanni TaxID=139649 RepID=UPI0018CF88C2|nr:uncharacterized protein LOC119675303 [Teleopsis dalmanni]